MDFIVSHNVSRFAHGEYVVIRAFESAPLEDDVSFTVYSTRAGEYIGEGGSLVGAVPHEFVTTVDALPTGEVLHTAYVNTSSLMNDDFLVVTFDDGIGGTFVRYAEVGTFSIASDGVTVEVYGFLRGAYGEPLQNKLVTFTVMNSATYFDNTPTTSLVASAMTDASGKFSIHLNRNYKYVLSIQDLSYLKVIDLTTLPAGATVVEVDLGSGLGC